MICVTVRCSLPLCQVRLLELYDIIDLFVLYEVPFTHIGVPKPLYFSDSLAGMRKCGHIYVCMRC